MSIISTHAPRGGSDTAKVKVLAAVLDFNPRSPRGERLYGMDDQQTDVEFQPTLPAGGATHGFSVHKLY